MAKKKISELNLDYRKKLVDRESTVLTITCQCDLLGLSRSSFYYHPCPESQYNLELMYIIDKLYMEHPEYGSRSMVANLRAAGYSVGRDRVRRLMKKMGIEAIYQKPNLSKAHSEHKIYPYLLRGVKIERINQVWSTDITYIRMKNGFLYLTVVMDWYSRYVLTWKISNSLDGLFCRESLLEALEKDKPEIFNTDQGSQFTSEKFTSILIERGIKPSMDGRGRALDNVFIERLWRSLKYENIYLKEYRNGIELEKGMRDYFLYYNENRFHSSLNYQSPSSVYRRGYI